jgi:hypothetical protein
MRAPQLLSFGFNELQSCHSGEFGLFGGIWVQLGYEMGTDRFSGQIVGVAFARDTAHAWLGHKNLETTQRYLGVTDSGKLRSQIDAAFGD